MVEIDFFFGGFGDDAGSPRTGGHPARELGCQRRRMLLERTVYVYVNY